MIEIPYFLTCQTCWNYCSVAYIIVVYIGSRRMVIIMSSTREDRPELERIIDVDHGSNGGLSSGRRCQPNFYPKGYGIYLGREGASIFLLWGLCVYVCMYIYGCYNAFEHAGPAFGMQQGCSCTWALHLYGSLLRGSKYARF